MNYKFVAVKTSHKNETWFKLNGLEKGIELNQNLYIPDWRNKPLKACIIKFTNTLPKGVHAHNTPGFRYALELGEPLVVAGSNIIRLDIESDLKNNTVVLKDNKGKSIKVKYKGRQPLGCKQALKQYIDETKNEGIITEQFFTNGDIRRFFIIQEAKKEMVYESLFD